MIHKSSKNYIISTDRVPVTSHKDKRIFKEIRRLINTNGGLAEVQLNRYLVNTGVRINLYKTYSMYKIRAPMVGNFSRSKWHSISIPKDLFVREVYEHIYN